jgi:Large polyvalent protein associated domain 38
MDRAEKVVYVNGFGLMRVPVGLQGEDLEKYVSQEVDKSLSAPKVEKTSVESKSGKSVGPIDQVGAFLGTLPEGIASGVGSTLSGLGALTTIEALKKAGAGVSEFGRDISEELLTPEQRESMGASGGRLAGNILTYLTPGVAAKALGAAPRAAMGISSLISGLSGAGEQEEMMQKAVESGAEISPEKRWLLAAGAGAASAALERLPLEQFMGSKVASKIPFIGKFLSEGLDPKTVQAVEKRFAGDPARIAEELDTLRWRSKMDMGLGGLAGSAARGAVVESPVEGLQQVTQNVLAKYGYNPEQQITEGLKEALVGGAIGGAAIQGGVDLFDSMQSRKLYRQKTSEAAREKGVAPKLPETALQDTLYTRVGDKGAEESRFVVSEIEKEARAREQEQKRQEQVDQAKAILASQPEGIGSLPGNIRVDEEGRVVEDRPPLYQEKRRERFVSEPEADVQVAAEGESTAAPTEVQPGSILEQAIQVTDEESKQKQIEEIRNQAQRRVEESIAAEKAKPLPEGSISEQGVFVPKRPPSYTELRRQRFEPEPPSLIEQVLGATEESIDQRKIDQQKRLEEQAKIAEDRQFSRYKTFDKDAYRSVLEGLQSSPEVEVSVPSLVKNFNIKPVAATSMMSLMRNRGDVTESNGKFFVNTEAQGPIYQLSEEPEATTKAAQPEAEQVAQPAQAEESKAQAAPAPKADPKQAEFNEQIANQYAPDLISALRKRNAEDLFVLGIAGALRDQSGKASNARGSYLDRVIYIATAPDGNLRSQEDMSRTLDHEIIHGMKKLNMFSDAEWRMLTTRFKVDYLGDDLEKRYRAEYKGRPNLEEVLREEAIAKAAADLTKVDPKRLDPIENSLLKKTQAFLGFGRKAAEMGYQSAEDVLAAVKSGEIGQRRYTPAVEQLPGGKQTSAQREIKITPVEKIPEPYVKPAETEKTAEAEETGEKKKKQKSKGKKEGKKELDPMLSMSEEDVEEPTEAQAQPTTSTGGVTRAFAKPQKEGILDRILSFFSYDKRSSFRQKFLDRYDPVREWAEKAYEKTGDIKYKAAASGAYQALLFSDKSQEISMEGFLRGGFAVEDGILKAVENSAHSPMEIFRKLAAIPASSEGFDNKLEEFFEAALAKRSLDIYRLEGNPGGTLSKEQLEANWNAFKDDSDIKEAMDGFKGFNDNLIDILVKSGAIDRKTAYKWKQSYYIPFYRLPTVKTADGTEETGEVDIPRVGQKATNLAAAKALTGRKLAVNDAIENIIANTYFMIGTAMKNNAALRVVRDGLEMEYMRKIEAPKEAEEGTNVINVRRNGVKEYYQVGDPMVYDAVAKSGIPVQDALKMMGKFTQVLRKGVTLSPTFILKNPVRDTLQVWMQGDLGSDLIPPIGEMAKGIASVFNNSPEYMALRAAGVAGSGIKQNTIKDTADEIRSRIGLKQDNIISKFLGYLEKASEKSEAITRTQVYKDVLEKTGSEAEALFAAMETINFSRRGTSRGVQIAIALLPFFNARLQGLDVFYRRAIRGEKLAPTESLGDLRKRAIQRMTYVAGLSAIYAAAMAGNEAWQNATDEERDGNIFIPVDWVPGVEEGTVLKFPIPQEFGIVTKMLPERLVSMYMGQSDGPELVDAMSRAIMGTLAFDPQVQAFRPVFEVSANYDFYTQKPIENNYLQRLLPGDRYTEFTPEIYKEIGEATGVSPVKLQHMVRGYTGTLGAYTADVASLLFGAGAENPQPERFRASQPYLLPVVGPLFKSAQGRRAVEAMYELQSVSEMASNTLKLAMKGQRDMSPERMEELQSMLYIDKAIQPALKRMQTLNRMKRTVQATPQLSAAEKRDQLNEIQKEMIEVSRPLKELQKQVPARYRVGISRLLSGS